MSEIDSEPKRIKRGRPKKIIVEPVILDESEIKRIPRGRPRSIDITDFKEYQKEYYKKNKEKTKGDYFCEKCNFLCSKANKSRHNAKYHAGSRKPTAFPHPSLTVI